MSHGSPPPKGGRRAARSPTSSNVSRPSSPQRAPGSPKQIPPGQPKRSNAVQSPVLNWDAEPNPKLGGFPYNSSEAASSSGSGRGPSSSPKPKQAAAAPKPSSPPPKATVKAKAAGSAGPPAAVQSNLEPHELHAELARLQNLCEVHQQTLRELPLRFQQELIVSHQHLLADFDKVQEERMKFQATKDEVDLRWHEAMDARTMVEKAHPLLEKQRQQLEAAKQKGLRKLFEMQHRMTYWREKMEDMTSLNSKMNAKLISMQEELRSLERKFAAEQQEKLKFKTDLELKTAAEKKWLSEKKDLQRKLQEEDKRNFATANALSDVVQKHQEEKKKLENQIQALQSANKKLELDGKASADDHKLALKALEKKLDAASIEKDSLQERLDDTVRKHAMESKERETALQTDKGKNSELVYDLKRAQEEVKNMEKALAAEKEALEAEKQVSADKAANEERLSAEKAAIEKRLSDEKDQLQQSLALEEKKQCDMAKKVADLEHEQKEMKSKYEQITLEQKEMETKHQQTEAALEEKTKEAETQNADKDSKENTMKSQIEKLEANLEENKIAENNLRATFEEEKATLQTKLDEANSTMEEKAALQNQLTEALEGKAEVQKRLDSIVEEKEALQKKVEEASQAVEQKESLQKKVGEASEVSEEMSEKSVMLEELKTKNDELASKNDALAMDLVTKQDALAQAEGKILGIEMQLVEKEAALPQVQESLAKAEEKIDALTKQLDKAKDAEEKIDALTKQLDKAKDALLEADGKVAASTQELGEKEATPSSLTPPKTRPISETPLASPTMIGSPEPLEFSEVFTDSNSRAQSKALSATASTKEVIGQFFKSCWQPYYSNLERNLVQVDKLVTSAPDVQQAKTEAEKVGDNVKAWTLSDANVKQAVVLMMTASQIASQCSKDSKGFLVCDDEGLEYFSEFVSTMYLLGKNLRDKTRAHKGQIGLAMLATSAGLCVVERLKMVSKGRHEIYKAMSKIEKDGVQKEECRKIRRAKASEDCIIFLHGEYLALQKNLLRVCQQQHKWPEMCQCLLLTTLQDKDLSIGLREIATNMHMFGSYAVMSIRKRGSSADDVHRSSKKVRPHSPR